MPLRHVQLDELAGLQRGRRLGFKVERSPTNRAVDGRRIHSTTTYADTGCPAPLSIIIDFGPTQEGVLELLEQREQEDLGQDRYHTTNPFQVNQRWQPHRTR